jgi:DNA-binding Lrp family transcriptional regulator
MSPDELRALGQDIKEHGLTSPVALWRADPKAPLQLLDGRNRLDAIEIATGLPAIKTLEDLNCDEFIVVDQSVDPYAYVISANIHRRHLSIEDKDRLIVELLKADPTKSNRAVAKLTDTSHPHVAKVREQAEKTGDVETVSTSVDTKGRHQPAKRTRNNERPKLYREMKLGTDVMAKIKGTSLDSAAEMDELINLNRGAPEGEQTEIVQRLIAKAVAGEQVSAVEYTNSGAAFRREGIGPDSMSEADGLRVRVEELHAEVRQRDIKIIGLENELEEAKAAKPAGDVPLTVLIEMLREIITDPYRSAWFNALSQHKQKYARALIERLQSSLYRLVDLRALAAKAMPAAAVLPPPDDGLGIPDFLDQTKNGLAPMTAAARDGDAVFIEEQQ